MTSYSKNTFFTNDFFQSSCPKMFFKIDVFKNVANFTGKHLCWSLALIKLQALREPASWQIFSSWGVINRLRLKLLIYVLFQCTTSQKIFWDCFTLTPLYHVHPLHRYLALAGRLLHSNHLCILLAAGLQLGTFVFRVQVAKI